MADPHFKGGEFYDGRFPHQGMKLARAIATVTYRSGPEWEQRFGRETMEMEKTSTVRGHLGPEFLIENYIDYQVRSSGVGRWYDVLIGGQMVFSIRPQLDASDIKGKPIYER
eukprot:GHVN01011622.1.p1 GENE.GHVN01011622.1~~GHVN01011622.1.p1  ORF type:complete len:112 (+),score=4.19 GHVN01011622.1:196-531(+)